MPQTSASPQTPPLPEIPGYRLLCVVAHGGMAIVYRGTQLSLGRDVAIKVMRPEALADEVSRRRFENEARTIARLEHPHIVSIHEVGRTGEGLPWYSMPYLPHGHLGQRASVRHAAGAADDGSLAAAPAPGTTPPGALPEARVREILRALLSALGYAHVRGVIHRDVKAENVLFDEADRPLLADFGIALRRGYGTRVTMAGLAVGSTAYMAPEQARGHQVDKRADLYSVGVLAWEMLNGSLPYQADDALAMAIMHTQNPIPRLPPRLRHWQRFMDRALAKEPGRRFADAAEMQEAIDRVPMAGSPTSALTRATDALATGAGRPARIVLACVALLVVAATGVWLLARGDALPTPVPVIATADAAADADASGDAREAGATRPDTVPGTATVAAGASSAEVPASAPPDLSRAPISASDRHLAEAERQIRAGRLTTPAGDNALDQLLAAARADPEHLRIPATAERLFEAIGRRAVQRIERGEDAEAAALLAQVRRQAAPLDVGGFDAMRPVRPLVAGAVEARIDKAIAAVDRDDARAALAAADAVGLDASDTARLRRAAMTIPQLDAAGDHAPAGLRVVRGDAGAFAIARAPVTRAEYARFANATGRKPAPCGRAALRRARNWESPGFDQAPGDPVVCVSWHDAIDYARWISERTGQSVVVASLAQGATQPPAAGAPSEWRSDCPQACRQRVAVGSNTGTRELDPARGYDDVGFRLVRLP